MQILKIGGNELGDETFLSKLAQTVAAFEEPVVIVHGGGQAIADMQARLSLPENKVDGLRVTDSESLVVTQMVLSGQINKIIVVALLSAGVMAAGISGVDGGLLRCVKKQHPLYDLGFVGDIVQVHPQIVRTLTENGIVPVISPISLGLEGQPYNVNADEAAGALATALPARVLSFISNVPGVLDQNNQPIPRLTTAETEQLIQSGIIRDGMVPKVRTALNVVGQGVPDVRIISLSGLAGGMGTRFSA